MADSLTREKNRGFSRNRVCDALGSHDGSLRSLAETPFVVYFNQACTIYPHKKFREGQRAGAAGIETYKDTPAASSPYSPPEPDVRSITRRVKQARGFALLKKSYDLRISSNIRGTARCAPISRANPFASFDRGGSHGKGTDMHVPGTAGHVGNAMEDLN